MAGPSTAAEPEAPTERATAEYKDTVRNHTFAAVLSR